jgi:dipeptidyl aminopeptidase/acylaminoacyl peptidase
MNRFLQLLLCVLLPVSWAQAQEATITVTENLTADGIPPIPVSIIDEVKNYTESRGAALADWHPKRKELLIATRFANSIQLHHVKMAGGARTQMTFFSEPVSSAIFQPVTGDYFLFSKDIGGNEFSQIHRFDIATRKIQLLTDGKRSQNGGIRFTHKGDRIAYSSTKRNGQDRDIFIMNPLDPTSDKLLVQNKGGGWSLGDWSPDDAQIILNEGLSINESRIHIVDAATGAATRLLPEQNERTTYSGIGYSKDGKGIYAVTNKDNEFNRLAYIELATKKITYISTAIPWGVEDVDISRDGSKLAFVTNENGLSKLYILNTANNKYMQVDKIPTGVIAGTKWSADSKSLALTMVSYNSSADVYEYNSDTKDFIRWTESELGGMDVSRLQAPKLISWKSFDGKMISGYFYEAASNFTGKRPVIVNIHGGPESQSQPSFIGRSNYFLNELGVSIIYPNVRGSSGYGKTFLDLDNGMKREESVKDIGALLDWIAQQPNLDKDRVMITGGSYGGYMTLASAVMYNDRIRCALDVVGISNFNTFLKNTESYRRDLRRVEYGNEQDPAMAEFLEKISPLNHAEKITKPLFIVQGGNDPRVPHTEAVQVRDKVKQNGTEVWFLMANDEGHGFRKKNNVDFQFYATVEFIRRFLLK